LQIVDALLSILLIALVVYLNAELNHLQSTRLLIFGTITLVLRNILLLVQFYYFNQDMFTALKGLNQSGESVQDQWIKNLAWEQSTTASKNLVLYEFLATYILILIPILIYGYFSLQLSITQLVYLGLAVVAASVFNLILDTLILEVWFEPVMQALLPPQYEDQLAGIKGWPLRVKLIFSTFGLVVLTLLLVVPTAYHQVYFLSPDLMVHAQPFIIIMGFGSVIAGTILGFRLTSMVSTPFNKMIQLFKEIEKGDFSQRIEISTPDEFGSLGIYLNRMLDRIQVLTKKLEQKVVDSSDQLSQVSKQLSQEISVRDESADLFRALFELSPDSVVLIDPHDPEVSWPIVDCNAAACRMNGYTREEMVGQSIDILNTTVGSPEERAAYFENLRKSDTLSVESQHRHKQGHTFPVEIGTSVIKVGDRELILSIDRDITERKQAEAKIEQSLSTINATLEASTDAILVVDGKGEIMKFNQHFPDMWGIPDFHYETWADKKTLLSIFGQLIDPSFFVEKVLRMFKEPDNNSSDILEFKDGRVFECYSQPQEIAGKSFGRVWNFRNITERKLAEEKLVYTALHDPLTNLPNRILLMDRLQLAMERASRNEDNIFAVIFLDLDRFKVVNDSLGHRIGDMLLIECASRLQACLRGKDTVARLGGDEFVCLLEDIKDTSDVLRIANRILSDLAEVYELEGNKAFISLCMGIVMSPENYQTPDDILRDADIAMYRAKGLGRGRFEIFDLAMRDRAMSRLELENDLRSALELEQFILHYQPIFNLEDRHVVGFEALVRWNHPTRGLISPMEFIPLAEESGLIVPLGYWVLDKACSQIRVWQEQYPSDPPLTVNVNLSTKQCAHADLIETISGILEKTNLEPKCLKLELTESLIVEDSEATSSILVKLRELGVKVQIDDFGTAYSSLSYLHTLPIDTLKIDRTFINRLGTNEGGLEIAQTILALAHSLGMKVIAEGVETEIQMSKLKEMDCEYIQGFLLARPVDSQAAGNLLGKPLQVSRIELE